MVIGPRAMTGPSFCGLPILVNQLSQDFRYRFALLHATDAMARRPNFRPTLTALPLFAIGGVHLKAGLEVFAQIGGV